LHLEDVLAYKQDLDYLRDRLLYRLTVEAQTGWRDVVGQKKRMTMAQRRQNRRRLARKT